MNKETPLNRMSVANRFRFYLKHPVSFLLFLGTCFAAMLTLATVLFIILYILVNGIPYIKPSLFAWKYTSENVSLLPAVITTIQIILMTLLVSVPLGIATAIYLVEYAKRGNKLVEIIRITAETLSGIPSIVYSLFGMLFFVTYLRFGFSILSGSLTLAIMILPLIIRSTEEALFAVSDTYREASFGLGAGKLRTVFRVVLPSAIPGIFAGIILAIGRIVGESAALIYTAGTVAKIPNSIFSSGRTLAIHMYALSSEGFHINEAYATAVVLLVVVLLINFVSSGIARRMRKDGK